MINAFDNIVAEKIGIEGAILLGHVNYWVEVNQANDIQGNKAINGYYWTFNSYKSLANIFSYMTPSKIRRTLIMLKDEGYILIENHNSTKYDRTNWYTITEKGKNLLGSKHQNKPVAEPKKEKEEIVTVTQEVTEFQEKIPYNEIIEHLNLRVGAKYRASNQNTRKIIQARFKEGYTLDDFKMVIDKKCVEWSNDPKMSQYLRPMTLFGTKFESYLNQNVLLRKEELSLATSALLEWCDEND